MFKKFFAAFFIGVMAMEAIAFDSTCAQHYANGRAPQITNQNLLKQARELCFSEFGVVHSGLTKTPLWSAEHLTRERLDAAKGMVRVDSFHEESSLPASERAELRDFSRSGWDRGHLSPNGDMPDSLSQGESFSLANMIPQDPNNNRNLWEGVESSIRSYVKHSGDVYVVTGPLFVGESIKQLNGRVLIPTKIFKAVYDPKKQGAAAYLVSNAPGMDYAVVSIGEIEKMAGFEVFPGLPSNVKNNKIELPVPTPHGHGEASSSGGGSEMKMAKSALKHMFQWGR